MKKIFEKFCSENAKGDRDAARIFYKMAETYILMDIYKLEFKRILNKDEDYIKQINRINIYNLLFQMWD